MQLYANQNQIGVAILVLFLISFSNLTAGTAPLATWPLWILIVGIWVLAQSLLADGVAQIFGHEAQSMRLFQWLALTYSPVLLLPALHILLQPTNAILAVALLLVYAGIVLLQMFTFRRLYGVGNLEAIGLTFAPPLVFAGLLFLLMICLGVIVAAS